MLVVIVVLCLDLVRGSECCSAWSAACMACRQDVTVEEFCRVNAGTWGCDPAPTPPSLPSPSPPPPPSPQCCGEWTAACIACRQGITVEAFCRVNAGTWGCDPASPPSLPPPPPLPPSRPQDSLHAVTGAVFQATVTFTASGSVEDYDDARRAQLLNTLVHIAGLPSSEGATLRISASSVRIEAAFVMQTAAELALVGAALASRLATPEAASAALGLRVESAPVITEAATAFAPGADPDTGVASGLGADDQRASGLSGGQPGSSSFAMTVITICACSIAVVAVCIALQPRLRRWCTAAKRAAEAPLSPRFRTGVSDFKVPSPDVPSAEEELERDADMDVVASADLQEGAGLSSIAESSRLWDDDHPVHSPRSPVDITDQPAMESPSESGARADLQDITAHLRF